MRLAVNCKAPAPSTPSISSTAQHHHHHPAALPSSPCQRSSGPALQGRLEPSSGSLQREPPSLSGLCSACQAWVDHWKNGPLAWLCLAVPAQKSLLVRDLYPWLTLRQDSSLLGPDHHHLIPSNLFFFLFLLQQGPHATKFGKISTLGPCHSSTDFHVSE